ncbi:glycosyltransferase family 4 protein [Yoonia sp.]|uniref:glycosyltransferase family 4 protein n=1 Tax=Yoonia sp. TaxID=2212373 RepID=UPI002FD9EA8D
MHIVITTNLSFVAANFRGGLIRALVAAGHRVTVLAPEDRYSKTLRRMGAEVVPVPIARNGANPLVEARSLAMIHARLRHLRPDMVFSYTIKNNIYAGLACRALGLAFVPNVTGLGPAFGSRGVLGGVVRWLYGVALRRAVRVFFQNADDRAVFVDKGVVAPDRAHLLPGSGVNLTRFAMAGMPDDEHVVFLVVARMLRDKGIGVFVEAARGLKARHPAVAFQLLGPVDPDSKTAIPQAQIDAWVAEGVVTYLGSKADVRPAIRQAHCVVLPSFYREGTPRSLLEAGAMGRPLITTDMPGCRDTVADGVNGFLVPPQDAKALAEAMGRFLALTPAQRAAMGAASRRHVESHYDERIVVDAYLDLIKGA